MQGKLETRVGIFVVAAVILFIGMGAALGSFRFDRGNYHTYIMKAKDLTGVTRKTEIKIAGVSVGWIESTQLVDDAEYPARAVLSVKKIFTVHIDATAYIRQEQALGAKYVELQLGSSASEIAKSGELLKAPLEQLGSFDDLYRQIQKVAAYFESLAGNVQSYQGEIESLVSTGRQLKTVINHCESALLPALQTGVQNFNDLSESVNNTVQYANQVFFDQPCDTSKYVVPCGGDDFFHQIKNTTNTMCAFARRLSNFSVFVDSHIEAMVKRAADYCHPDSKGYIQTRVYPIPDMFFLFQLVSSERGYLNRNEYGQEYCNDCNHRVNTRALDLPDWARLAFVFDRKEDHFKRNTLKFGIQVGASYQRCTARVGIFEGFAGAALDVDMPTFINHTKWISTLEMFDLRGWNRVDDRSPHLKWLNRFFINDIIYGAFGVDDFVSRNNSSPFFGIGIRFGADALTSFLPS